jgi:hypothetical protein
MRCRFYEEYSIVSMNMISSVILLSLGCANRLKSEVALLTIIWVDLLELAYYRKRSIIYTLGRSIVERYGDTK